MYEERKSQLVCLFQTFKSFVITVDLWTERFTGIHYVGISLHNVNAQFQLQPFALCCRAYELESQTSVNVRRFVNSIFGQFGLSLGPSSSYIVSENENKMCCAFGDLKRIGCSDHYLNKILEKTFTNEKLFELEELSYALIDEVIEKLSVEQRPTIHLVVLLRQYLLKCCVVWYKDDDDNESGLISVKKFIATILHPQLTHFDKTPADKTRAMQLLQNEIVKRANQNKLSSFSSTSNSSSCTPIILSLPTSSSEQTATETKKKSLLSLCFGDPRSPTSIVDEFASWMSSTLVLNDEEKDDVLGFWSHHGKSFCIISTIISEQD
ncbi:unnamed protein product [Rotaria magnacalcarata]